MKQRAAAWILAVSLAAGALVAAEHALFLSTPDLLPFTRPDGPSATTVVVEVPRDQDGRGGPQSNEPGSEAADEPVGEPLTVADVVPTSVPDGPDFVPPSLDEVGYLRDGEVELQLGSIGIQGLDAVIERQLAVLADNSCGPFGPWVVTGKSTELPPGTCALYRIRVGDEVVFTLPEPVRFDGSKPELRELAVVEDAQREHFDGSTLYLAADAASPRPVTVTASASDPESGLASATFSNGGGQIEVTSAPWSTQLVPSPGPLAVTVANNPGDTTTSSVAVVSDGTAPEGVTISYPSAAAAGESVAIATDAGSDTGSGVDPSSLTIERRSAVLSEAGCEAFGGWAAAGASNVAREGTCAQYRVRVSDNVGNETVVRSETVLEVADLGAPTTAITAPAAGSELNGVVTVTASAVDEGTGIRSVTIQVARSGSGDWIDLGTTNEGPHAASWDTLAVEPGPYDLRSIATDRAGNGTVSDVVGVVVEADEEGPSTSITSPAVGSSVSGVVTVSATAADEGSGVASVTVQVSAGGCWTDLGSFEGGSGSVAWDTTGLEPGTYALRSVAVDRRGNVAKSETVWVVIEEPEPAEEPEEPIEEPEQEVEPPTEVEPPVDAEEPEEEPVPGTDSELEPEPELEPDPESDSNDEPDAGPDDLDSSEDSLDQAVTG